MTDPDFPDFRGNNPASNVREFSVSELSFALKRTVEENFEYVRVRGEISGFKRAASGHLYMALKDESAVLDAICWKGVASKLKIRPEDGLEVIATGKLTTFPGRSKYQIVIQSMEAAGVGALMALLEERRRKLTAEGVFDAARKRPIPYLPGVIGVITSPTGAVIRDILHRLADRFPRHVLVWPVLVQGETAAAQVAAAIRRFNRIEAGGRIPRPDVLIVARGGGSLEDLWAFNEEIVVRAAAESDIPLISAVGHETDTTLIDHAADLRAPTPTAAAEMAVPVHADLIYTINDLARRHDQAKSRYLTRYRDRLQGLARALPSLNDLLALPQQRFDSLTERLPRAAKANIQAHRSRLETASARLAILGPVRQLERKQSGLSDIEARLHRAMDQNIRDARARLAMVSGQLKPAALGRDLTRHVQSLDRLSKRMGVTFAGHLQRIERDFVSKSRLLESFSYHKTLGRGYAVVRDGGTGALVTKTAGVVAGRQLNVELQDGRVDVVAAGAGSARPVPAKRPASRPVASDDKQGTLL